jgi:hypothetical protein
MDAGVVVPAGPRRAIVTSDPADQRLVAQALGSQPALHAI